MKIILDLDTGIDDALAIAYTLAQPKAELIGITTLFGNVTVDLAVKNSLNILDLLGHNEVPVFEGAAHPLEEKDYQTSDHLHLIHGFNGLGNVELGEPTRQKEQQTAVDFLIQSAEKYQDELILVTAGPMTNLALALQKAPDSMKKIGKIVSMAGAVTTAGNVTPHAEANIYNDVPAAHYCLTHDVKMLLVGLDVTLKTMITGKEINHWLVNNNRASQVFVDFSNYYYSNEYGDSAIGGALHDPLAVALALYPEWLTDSIMQNLTVEKENFAYGRTEADLSKLKQTQKSSEIAIDIATDEFIADFISSVERVLSLGK